MNLSRAGACIIHWRCHEFRTSQTKRKKKNIVKYTQTDGHANPIDFHDDKLRVEKQQKNKMKMSVALKKRKQKQLFGQSETQNEQQIERIN